MNEAIIQLLQPLAETLKTTIYHIWDLQLRQVYIDGFHALCVLILGLALIVIPIKRWKALNKILKSDTPIDGISKDDIDSLRFGLTMLILLGSILVLYYFPTVLTCFMNPEYHAVKELRALVK